MKKTESQSDSTASQQITNQISELTDWRGKLLARLRTVIVAAAPGITEDWKWGSAVFVNHGNVVSLGVFKDHLKINFFQGAALSDPHSLFNAGLEAKTSRGIDLFEGDKVNETALKDLIRAAVAFNASGKKQK